ncbi:MAG: tetratricopeptide repeat protein [Prevotella sp.]|uniref:type IX secretion system periplasmic lipoprotein PorW/SprE n=1 Tax=Prevotella sp. TaxID=59823 RepID=UPI0025E27542|nr:tetratricopeptide repeat protein [Prevotella sp.]MCI7119431.1 tetratricopeptide repeat protein [Prevotella sp.]
MEFRHIIPLLIAAIIVAATGCSTQKNTAKTRFWHSFKARYNTYYNGSLAYIDGSLEKENGNKDNFTETLPLYTVSNKQSRELGKANFDRAIEKCQKTIKLHSIKRRPEWTKNRRKTEKDIEWLSRREYNPFLWRAWLLMGRSQFYKGAFDEAASTFAYMGRLYQTQPAIYAKSRAWLAKSYIEEGWLYDAEDVIRGMERDSIHWSARKEWDYTYADYYIHTGDYAKAVPYLRRVIKHEMRRKQRAREWYLMGQLQAALGNKAEALKAYKKVVRQNPPYEIEFNARIAMTEVLSGAQSKKMIGRLKRMAASDKNKDYLDQVYYALGNIYMARQDTANAISSYERGAAKATRSGIEKGVLMLRLGDIYWDMERYGDAQRCYGEAIGMLDKERKDYEQLSERSKVLDQLVPYTDAVQLQDSLQELARMPEAERNAAIDRTIAELKRKEREERRKQQEEDAQQTISQNSGNNAAQNHRPNAAQQNQQNANALWYFYNPMAVSQGKAAFEKLWGKRENADNWQRINKTVVATMQDEPEMSQEQLDSIAHAEAVADSLAQIADSAQNDPHRREYYLAQIPFTKEQVDASNKVIEDGLFNSGVIFKDKLDNLPLAEKQLTRLVSAYTDYERLADAYYHLYLLYMRKGDAPTADTYVARLKKEYPENEWTILLSDPHFVENARFGAAVEDSLYASTYDAFKAARYKEVAANVKVSTQRFPLGANRDKFVFIGGLGKLNEGDADGCLKDMKTVVEKYPQSGVATMAGMIVKGVGEGRRLRGGQFDLAGVWDRRTVVLRDSDSTAVRQLSDDRNAAFVYTIVYRPDSVDENKLLFELARYNFTSYMVRNFEIGVEDADGLHRMTVSGFRNYDEALQYARQLHAQTSVARLIGNNRTYVISEPNLPLLGRQYSYTDYEKFYAKHFAPLKTSTEPLLTEPDFIAPAKPKNEDEPLDDFDTPSADTPNNNNVLLEDTPADTNNTGNTVIIEDNAAPANTGNTETIIEDKPQQETGNQTVITDLEPESKPSVKSEPKSEVIPELKPEVKSEPKPAVKPEPKPEVKPEEKPSARKIEDEFYFGDAPAPSQPATKKAQPTAKDKQKDDDFDTDEYYDLEGF